MENKLVKQHGQSCWLLDEVRSACSNCIKNTFYFMSLLSLELPFALGSLNLQNRIIMAPMTRSRADSNGNANALMAEYYRQRASAGLIITEGVYPAEEGKGYCRTPGIATSEQAESWRQVVDAVHKEGGKIVMQLMHCGRIAHPLNRQIEAPIIAPSSIKAKGEIYTEQGMKPFEIPEELGLKDIHRTIESYKQAAERAIGVGFDGVELHGTSGYLPAQFMATGTNQRHDQYGGSLHNRLRFVMETIEALSSGVGSDRVGIRLCPGNPFNDLYDENPKETYEALLNALVPLNLAYLHIIKSPVKTINSLAIANDILPDKIIANDGFDAQSANELIQNNQAAAVSFGRHFIANPDLVERFKLNKPLADFDNGTLYAGREKGYIDYATY